jgi:hypothetical protein
LGRPEAVADVLHHPFDHWLVVGLRLQMESTV